MLATLAILQELNGCLEESSISDPGGSFCFPLMTGSISSNNREYLISEKQFLVFRVMQNTITGFKLLNGT